MLVAVLDWGMGHATRCIPIIQMLKSKNCQPVLAGNGRAYEVLRKQFPELKIYRLSSYNPRYPAGRNMVLKMGLQLPKFLFTIWRERRETEKIVERENIDAVISDNRYNCYSRRVKSVFITHQTHVIMPPGHKLLEKWVNRINENFINNYSECWVPAPDAAWLGKLQHDSGSLRKRFIGHLSSMQKENTEKIYDVCLVCSGPEPQRSLLEKIVHHHLKKTDLSYIIVRGKPEALNPVYSHEAHRLVVNYLNSDELARVINQSRIVIARSGYSMIMDLAKLGARAIFIPTPGQTEQEHLASVMMQNNIAPAYDQRHFMLQKALRDADHYTGFAAAFSFDNSLLETALDSLLC